MSQQAFLCTGSHDHRSPVFEYDNGPPIVIERRLGGGTRAGSSYVGGVTAGANSVIGAAALVSADVPPSSFVLRRRRPSNRISPADVRILHRGHLVQPRRGVRRAGPRRLNQASALRDSGHEVTITAIGVRGYDPIPTEQEGVPLALKKARNLAGWTDRW